MNTCFECDKKVLARGLCGNHYMQKRRAGLLIARKKESDAEYIVNRIKVTCDGHWLWTKSKREEYGRLVRNGKSWSAHVFSYLTFNGDRPQGTQINHICHIRSCVNPAHLYAGTQKENMLDMKNAGRENILKGTKNGMAKINNEIVLEIREFKGPARIIAKKHGVSISLIYAIRHGVIWRHAK